MNTDSNSSVSFRQKKLRNGSYHPMREVLQTVDLISSIKNSAPDDFFELVKLCRFPSYDVTESCLQRLSAAGAILKGQVRDTVKDVVLSAVCGRTPTGLEVTSPFVRENGDALLLHDA